MSSSMLTSTFSCGGCDFLASKQPVACLKIPNSEAADCAADCHPVAVFFLEPSQVIDSTWVEKEKARMLSSDDVINEDFFAHIIFCRTSEPRQSASNNSTPGPVVKPSQFDVTISWLEGFRETCRGDSNAYGLGKNEAQIEWVPVPKGQLPRSGPYLLQGSTLYKVYRLYDDPSLAFVFGVTYDGASPPTFQKYNGGLVPVPSRLYSEPATQSFPLKGKRVAVKDIYHLAGTPTSASCRDFMAFTGAQEHTANMVLRLIQAGAVVVGKTKTAQFASGEHAGDWVDYACPFNPRGDGYLEPDCSSTGSAAAIAAYTWLDYSIGTDTLGSILGPAACQGIFGIRPTHGISDLVGIMPVSSHLDTAGFFARSMTAFRAFGESWYTNQRTAQPTRLLYATEEFDKFPSDTRLKMDSFVEDLEKSLGLTKVPFDVSAVWSESANGQTSLVDYLSTTLAHIQLFDCYRHNLHFREAFKKANGREPYANPMIRFKWDLGSRVTSEDYRAAREQQEVYRKFLREHVCGENTILILPGGNPVPRYRDVYDPPPEKSGFSLQGFGFLRDLYSFLGGLPQLVIPIGSVNRISPVTNGAVEEPVSVSLIGAEGTDCALMRLVERVLHESGRPSEVKTGATLF